MHNDVACDIVCLVTKNTDLSAKQRRLANLKPPWPKGTSGNPDGRPVGSRSTKTILQELLEMASEKTPGVTRHEAICAKLVVMAENGDLASVDRIFDRIEGKPKQAVEQTNVNANVEADALTGASDEMVAELHAVLNKHAR